MSKTYLWLHNIEKDFYKLVQLLRETFTTTPAQHVTTSDLQVLWGLKHGMDGWLLVTHTIFLSSKINWYFLLIYILRLYCFFLIFPHIFPTQQKNFFGYWRIFQIIPYPPPTLKIECEMYASINLHAQMWHQNEETEPIL